MRNLAFPLSVMLSVLCSCTAKERPEESAQQKLVKLNAIYDSSLLSHDTATIRKLLAEKYTFTNSEGQVLNKNQQLISIATSEMKWNRGRREDVNVTVFEAAAVLTGTFRGIGTYRGNPVTINERFSTFWIREDTSWQMAAEHISVIK